MGSLYSEHLTWLHRVSPALKLVLMAVLSTALFMLQSPAIMVGCAVTCGLLWLSLGKATRIARRLIISVLIAALLIAGFHAFMGNYALATTSALRLACASTLGVALTVTTHLPHSGLLEALLAPLARLGFPSQRFALQLALMIRFIEHFCAMEAPGRCLPPAHRQAWWFPAAGATEHPDAADRQTRGRCLVRPPGAIKTLPESSVVLGMAEAA